MDRREALKITLTILGGTVVGSQVFLSGCSSPPKEKSALLTSDYTPLLDEIGETILPETDQSPGAKAAHIGEFIKTIINDCYSEEESEIFVEGLKIIDRESELAYSNNFTDLSDEQKIELLLKFDGESRKTRDEKPHFFTMMKQLTIWGYFTSEPGATKALKYNPIPGRFEGCLPYEGENAWA